MINTCIQVKYLQATNNKGARLKAFDADNNSATIPFPYECSGRVAYRKAALEFMRKHWKLNIKYDMVEGRLANGNYVFINAAHIGCYLN
jgi:hypothetical protein